MDTPLLKTLLRTRIDSSDTFVGYYCILATGTTGVVTYAPTLESFR